MNASTPQTKKGWYGQWLQMMKELVCPNLYVPSVLHIDLDALWRRGIRALLLDLDNTITILHGREVSAPIRKWLDKAKQLGLFVCIVSNDSRESRVSQVASSIGVAFIANAFKPRRRTFLMVIQRLRLKPEQVAMVGDQLFTDILGGNLSGLFTILVQPLSSARFITGKIQRLFERPVLAWLEHQNLLRVKLE